MKRIEYTQTSNMSWRKLYASVNKIILSIYTQIVSKATMHKSKLRMCFMYIMLFVIALGNFV